LVNLKVENFEKLKNSKFGKLKYSKLSKIQNFKCFEKLKNLNL